MSLFKILHLAKGNRVAVKYYSEDWPTNSAKEAFEKSVFTKTQKTNARTEAEIAMFENNIVIYKFAQDLHFFVTGGDDENELIISTVLQGFFDAVGLLLRGNVDKKEALENLDLILLCVDEIVDGGIILETDANVIAGKVASHSVDSGAPLSEQTISQALATAREHLTRSLLKSFTEPIYLDIGDVISYRIPPTYEMLATTLNLPKMSEIQVDEFYLKGTLDLGSLASMMSTDKKFGLRNRVGLGEPKPQYESLQARLKAQSINNSPQKFSLKVSDIAFESYSVPERAADGIRRSFMSDSGTLQVHYVKVLEKGDTYENEDVYSGGTAHWPLGYHRISLDLFAKEVSRLLIGLNCVKALEPLTVVDKFL